MLNNGKSGLYPAWHFYLFGIPASFILPQALLFEELEINKDTDIILQKEPFRPNPLKD